MAMEILYLLIPFSAGLVFVILGLFAWAVQGGQFDDLDQQGLQIFSEADAPIDLRQGPPPKP